jgi:hypothetical protein
MRAIIAFGIFALGLGGAAPEPEYFSQFADYLYATDNDSAAPLVEIESSTHRGDRLTDVEMQPHPLTVLILRPGQVDGAVQLASASPDDLEITGTVSPETDGDTGSATEVSLDDLCHALFTSARDNDLPVPFFANLIWQESRLRSDDVSKKGAMGIAQFMPLAAAENGLDDPFDPLKAIPASARFLRTLRSQFGNLGLVAAAYNAGAHRVADWLQHHRTLPRETRGYVVKVTGLSVEAWRGMAVDGDALTFVRHLPCRGMPAFAGVEQEQLEQAELEQAKLADADPDSLPIGDGPLAKLASSRTDDRKHGREAHRAGHDRHTAGHEAAHMTRASHQKHKSVWAKSS